MEGVSVDSACFLEDQSLYSNTGLLEDGRWGERCLASFRRPVSSITPSLIIYREVAFLGHLMKRWAIIL